MPTKLESLKAEQKKLNNRKNLSASDEKRLQTLTRLIKQEERKELGFGPARYKVPAGASYLSPWQKSGTSGSSRSVDTTSDTVAAKRDQIRLAMGMDALSGIVEPIEDEQGNVSFGVNPQLADYRFGPSGAVRRGGLFGPARDAARAGLKGAYANTPGGRDITATEGMSVQQMLDFYYSMNDAELVQFQHRMVEAGLLEKPILGFRDPNTTKALGVLMNAWLSEPGRGIKEILDKFTAANSARLQEEIQKKMRESGSGTGVISDEVANITLTDEATLDSMVDKVAQNLLGQYVDPTDKAAIIAQLREEERQFKTAQVQSDFDQSVYMQSQDIANAAGGPQELDAFMNALIGQESGGNPNAVNADSGAMGIGQIMPENWGPWAAAAGANPADFSEANQRRVIKYKLAEYYQAYGNWRDVAIAWYGGHGGVLRARGGGGNNPEGAYPSLNAYADQVIAQMNAYTGSQLTAGRQPKIQINVGDDLADPQTRAEAKIKALDPAAYAGSQYAKHAEVFFNLLGGVN